VCLSLPKLSRGSAAHTGYGHTALHRADGLTHVDQVNMKFLLQLESLQRWRSPKRLRPRVPTSYGQLRASFETGTTRTSAATVITISGRAEIEVAGGQKIFAEPGRIAQAEDLTAKAIPSVWWAPRMGRALRRFRSIGGNSPWRKSLAKAGETPALQSKRRAGRRVARVVPFARRPDLTGWSCQLVRTHCWRSSR